MKLLKLILFFWGTFCCFSTAAQTTNFNYKRTIDTPADQWHRIKMPVEMYQHLAPSFRDIRIYGTTAKNDTIEVPYLLEKQGFYSSSEPVALEIFNKSSRGSRHYFTFDLKETAELTDLELNFQEKNFDWLVTLEGSQDLKKWYTISDGNRIVSIENNQVGYTYSKIAFPLSKYRYYRVALQNDFQPQLLNAQVFRKHSSEGKFEKYPVQQMTFQEDKTNKQTIVELTLPLAVPVSFIKVAVETEVDYYRKVSLQYLADSTESPKGKKYIYRTLDRGYLSSFENNKFYFSSKIAKRFRLVIENQDNELLDISKVNFKGHPTEIIARFGAPAAYALYYGNANLGSPQYDIASFKKTIPKNLSVLELGEPIRLEKPEEEKISALFTNKIWLYAIMVLIILLLGYFTLKMMKSSDDSLQGD